MSAISRLVLFVYSLALVILAGIAITAALGRVEILNFINLALASSQYRMILGVAAALVIVISIAVIFYIFKTESNANSILVDGTLAGQISITVPAIKVIIMKAVRKVNGVKDIRPVVSLDPEGLKIYLHMGINPDYSVPDMGKEVQAAVKQQLEDIGGLKVAQISLLIDDFGTSNQGIKA